MFKLWRIGAKEYEKNEKKLIGPLTSGKLNEVFGNSDDVAIKNVYTGNKNIKIKAVGIDGLVDGKVVDEYILKPLTIDLPFKNAKSEVEAYELIRTGFLYHLFQKEVSSLKEAVSSVLQGDTVLVFDNLKKAVAFDVKAMPQRAIVPSEDENVLKGAKDTFIETIRTNTALVRKKIKSPELVFESFSLGTETNTPVNIVYMNNTVDKEILDKLRGRIENLKIPSMISAENFESNICDNRYSLFPQLQYTERVDKFCANIIDGKIGVLIDGLPLGYIFPGLFAMYFQTPEDYSGNYLLSSVLRIIRYICFTISLVLPGFYIAITTFHHEMIPTNLLKSIIESKEGVPFSAFVEIILLLFAFEILLEASLRLPKTIGGTISIIGGLIVGEAAVNAKFLSPAVVVIVAITGIAGFVIPNRSLANAVRICRMIMVFAAGVSGLFGISFVLLIILAYLCKLETFGVPYLTPFVGNEGKNMLKDTLIRVPKDVGGE